MSSPAEIFAVVSDRPLDQYTFSEKAACRRHADPVAFCNFAGWPQSAKECFEDHFQIHNCCVGPDFEEFLAMLACADLLSIRGMLSSDQSKETVEWSSIPVHHDLVADERSLDDLIFSWMLVKQIDCDIHPAHGTEYKRLLLRLLPKRRVRFEDTLTDSFHREEKKTPDGRYPSQGVYDQIKAHYVSCTNMEDYVPLAPIVGPS